MSWLKWLTSYIYGFFPQKLPIGEKAYYTFFDHLFDTYGIPNHDSYHQLVSDVILHSKETKWKVAPYHFAKVIRKAQANEVAWHVKEQIRAKAKAEKEQQEQDAKTAPAETSLVEPTTHVGTAHAETTH